MLNGPKSLWIWNMVNPSFPSCDSKWVNSTTNVTVFRLTDFQLDNSFFIQDNNNWIKNLDNKKRWHFDWVSKHCFFQCWLKDIKLVRYPRSSWLKSASIRLAMSHRLCAYARRYLLKITSHRPWSKKVWFFATKANWTGWK